MQTLYWTADVRSSWLDIALPGLTDEEVITHRDPPKSKK